LNGDAAALVRDYGGRSKISVGRLTRFAAVAGRGEVELESQLRKRFRGDLIEPMPKGEFDGDVVHAVVSASGWSFSTILWKSKRAKSWNLAWLWPRKSFQGLAIGPRDP
jgi:hypothetical protein